MKLAQSRDSVLFYWLPTAANSSPMQRSVQLLLSSLIVPAAPPNGKLALAGVLTNTGPSRDLCRLHTSSHSAIISSAVELMVSACSCAESDIRLSATENLRRLIKVRNRVHQLRGQLMLSSPPHPPPPPPPNLRTRTYPQGLMATQLSRLQQDLFHELKKVTLFDAHFLLRARTHTHSRPPPRMVPAGRCAPLWTALPLCTLSPGPLRWPLTPRTCCPCLSSWFPGTTKL